MCVESKTKEENASRADSNAKISLNSEFELAHFIDHLSSKFDYSLKEYTSSHNYEDDLLRSSKYPEGLKKRISSKYGHLSNSSAMRFAKDLLQRERKVLVAAHLSSNNNSHNYVAALLDELCHEKKTESFIADQDNGTPWINLG